MVIFFTCNHCPYVIGSDGYTESLAKKYQKKGVQFIGINSNSATIVPEDDFNGMINRMGQNEFSWVYLRDETQETALSYGAQKTPHFFVFDKKRDLLYHGAAIDNPKSPNDSTKHYLDEVLHQATSNEKPLQRTYQPIGCTIKWKPENVTQAESCDVVF